MPSRTSSWPSGWPSFTPKDNDLSNTFQKVLKASVIAEYGAEALHVSWTKTCNALNSVTSRISTLGNTSIPVLSYDEALSATNYEFRERMKATGCFIIRGVISKAETVQHFGDLKTFIADNEDIITGWPAKSVAIYHLPTIFEFALDRLVLFTSWGSCSVRANLYPDALRIRQPGQEFLGLGPHIDGGSLARWADVEYRKTYHSILSGFPEKYDPYDMAHRKNANPAIFPSGAQSSVLRTFQGWTALTPCKPGEGGLMLVPDIKIMTAYMILRPFFVSPEDGDWRDPELWKVDEETGWFPGTYVWDSQLLSPASHPHLYLEDTLLSIPDMEPGDTVWWHADMCHAVETRHNGSGPASVCYIPAAPSTPSNLKYIRKHWKDLVAGVPPDDYKYLDGTGSDLILNELNERHMKGALQLNEISAEGRRALGEGL